MSDTVAAIKDRLSIVDVLSGYLKLEKAGANFKALCPFHSEKTPSFHISPERGSYYCFGCGEKGDIFSFVEKIEGVDFKSALTTLGERAGVQVVFEKSGARDERARLYELLEEATRFFEAGLTEEAKAYLTGRGLSEESIKLWRIGYVKNDWRLLLTHLRGKGYSDAEIEKAGLVKRPDNAPGKDLYDRFRSRIMFPIADSAGRIVAFTGRIFPNDDTIAKYLNSPETELFQKSKILFGFDKAKGHIRKSNFSILVEGQMDVVLTHQAGFRNAIALSGTALSAEHLTQLNRLSNRLVMALDADNAGISSAGKGARAALAAGFDVKVARLPKGMDPADLIGRDLEAFRKAVREATHIIDFYLAVLRERYPDERKYRLEAEKFVIPYIADIKSPIDQAHFVARVASALGLPEEPIWREVRARPVGSVVPEASRERSGPVKSRREMIAERLYGLLKAQESLQAPAISPVTIRERLESAGISLEDAAFTERSEELMFQAEENADGDVARYAEELLRALEEEMLRESQASLSRELREAESAGDDTRVRALSQSHGELSRKLHELRKRLLP
jgi:DNA primase